MTPTVDETERDGHLVGAERLTPRVVGVRPGPEARLAVTFDTGEQRVVDLGEWLNRGVFRELRAPDAFAAVEIVNGGGGVAWPSGADLCADTLYAGSLPSPTPST